MINQSCSVLKWKKSPMSWLNPILIKVLLVWLAHRTQRHLSGSSARCDRKDLECAPITAKSPAEPKLNLYMTALSNIRTPSPGCRTQRLPPSVQTCRQVDDMRAGRKPLEGAGWPVLIGRLLYLEREEGRWRFPYKANSEPISSHILPGDSWFFPPSFYLFSLPLLSSSCSALHLFSLSFLFC